jgi:hypothetical protein
MRVRRSLTNGVVFFDMTKAPGEDAIDGIKVDRQGNLYVSGPGGLWIVSSTGKHLGSLPLPDSPEYSWRGGLRSDDELGRSLCCAEKKGPPSSEGGPSNCVLDRIAFLRPPPQKLNLNANCT